MSANSNIVFGNSFIGFYNSEKELIEKAGSEEQAPMGSDNSNSTIFKKNLENDEQEEYCSLFFLQLKYGIYNLSEFL